MKTIKKTNAKKILIAKTATAKKANTNRVSIVTNRDIWSSHPSSGLTPEKLASLLREAESGDISRQMELFEEIEEKDLHIVSCLNDRKDAVKNKKWKINPVSENPFDIKVADYCSELIKGIKRWRNVVYNIADAVGKGLSLHEIMWQPSDILKISSIDHIMPKKITFNDNLTEIRLITESAPVYGIPLEPNKFVLHQSQCKSGHPSRSSLLRLCSWFFLFKNFAVKDWTVFAEIYGMPLRIAKYDKNSGEEEKKVLEIALRQLGVDASALIPTECDIEIKESDKRSSGDIYERLAKFCNQELSKAIIGSTLTKEIGETGGAFSASETHSEVKMEIVESDAKDIDETIREDILKPSVNYQFGESVAIPEYETIFEKPVDYGKLADTYTKLVNMGFEIPVEHAHTEFNMPLPKVGEKVLKKPQDSFSFMNAGGFEAKAQSVLFAANQTDTIALKIARSKQNKEAFERRIMNYIDQAEDLYASRVYDLIEKANKASDFDEAIKILSEEKIDTDKYLKFGNIVLDALRESGMQGRIDARIEANVFSAKNENIDPFSLLPQSALDFLKVYSFETAVIKEKTTVENVRASYEKALREGQTFEQYKKENTDLWGSENKHIKTIFYTNMETLYAAGKYWEYNDPAYKERFPYFMYLTVGDENVREEHREMHGKIFRRDDAVWNIWWPPNGFNCRCDVIMVSLYEMMQRNLRVSTIDEAITMRDKNFERNAGKTNELYKAALSLFQKHKLDWNKTFKSYSLPEAAAMPAEMLDRKIIKAENLTQDKFNQILGITESGAIIKDFQNTDLKLNARSFEHIDKDKLSFIEYVKPTLERPDEIWGSYKATKKNPEKFGTRKIYIKRFQNSAGKMENFLTVVEVENGDVITWRKSSQIDEDRKGILLYFNK